MNREFIKKVAEEMIRLHKFLGLQILELEEGYVKIKVPYRKEVVGDIRKNHWHGGILATVMDSAGGIVGTTYSTSTQDNMATIDLRVDYLTAAKEGDIIVEGELVRLGKRIMVTRMKAFQENSEGKLVAEGKGVYNFIRKKEATK